MSDGTLSVRRRDTKASDDPRETRSRFDVPTTLSDINTGYGRMPQNTPFKISADAGEQRLQVQTSTKLKEHDKLLKNFKYSAALDSVLKKVGSLMFVPAFKVVKSIVECATLHNFFLDKRVGAP